MDIDEYNEKPILYIDEATVAGVGIQHSRSKGAPEEWCDHRQGAKKTQREQWRDRSLKEGDRMIYNLRLIQATSGSAIDLSPAL